MTYIVIYARTFTTTQETRIYYIYFLYSLIALASKYSENIEEIFPNWINVKNVILEIFL